MIVSLIKCRLGESRALRGQVIKPAEGAASRRSREPKGPRYDIRPGGKAAPPGFNTG